MAGQILLMSPIPYTKLISKDLDMEMGDDYEQLMFPDESPVPEQTRKLKRLKKGVQASKVSSLNPPLQDGKNLTFPNESPKSPDSTNFSDDVSVESGPESARLLRDKDSEEFDLLFPWKGEEKLGAKRALDFGGDNDEDHTGDEGFDASGETNKDGGEESHPSWDGFWDDKTKSKRGKKSGDRDVNEGKKKKKKEGYELKTSKRKETEVRKAQAAQLVDLQRELRERKDVGFKPVCVVQKPISSILEKIRQRKLHVSSKKAAFSSIKECNGPLREIVLDVDTEDDPTIDRVGCEDGRSVTPKADHLIDSPVILSDDNSPATSSEEKTSTKALEEHEDIQQFFRAPVNDTQDLFSELQSSNSQEGCSTEDTENPLDEEITPSLPSMNLKLDSAPTDDDISSDEEYNDKENNDSSSERSFKMNSSPRGDPVRQFVDEEAVEEEYSDNDGMNMGDGEDSEGNDDAEEIADMIATNYEEKPSDCERRNELHQKWLQQQDEAGTEDLLQKLNQKYGIKQGDMAALDDESEERSTEEADDDAGEEDAENLPTTAARVSTKMLRQMIPQMFTDKDDGYVSSEDEETDKRLSKQQVLGKMAFKEKVSFVSPAEDETSKEVFGRIRKLNIVQTTKKRARLSSYFETNLTKENDANLAKSSFLHRSSSIPVSYKHGSSTTKAFIFGRDDSNSRSSISIPEEDSSEVIDPIHKNSKVKRTFVARLSASQVRPESQISRSGKSNSTSLLDILRRPSVKEANLPRDTMVDHQAVFASLRATRRSLKIEVTS